jgi:hypothetical protein
LYSPETPSKFHLYKNSFLKQCDKNKPLKKNKIQDEKKILKFNEEM